MEEHAQVCSCTFEGLRGKVVYPTELKLSIQWVKVEAIYQIVEKYFLSFYCAGSVYNSICSSW